MLEIDKIEWEGTFKPTFMWIVSALSAHKLVKRMFRAFLSYIKDINI